MCGRLRIGRKFAYSSNFWRSATLMLEKPPPTGVVTGPFNPTRVRSIDSITSLGMYSPCFSKASAPTANDSHSNFTPVASRIRTVARVTSGPMPSPGIRVTLCAISKPSPRTPTLPIHFRVSILEIVRTLSRKSDYAHTVGVGSSATLSPQAVLSFARRIPLRNPLLLRVPEVLNVLVAESLRQSQSLFVRRIELCIDLVVNFGEANGHIIGRTAALRFLILRHDTGPEANE